MSVLTTGHEKLRVTVMLTARSDGSKCRPYVLLPRKRVEPSIVEKFKSKLHLAWEGTTWMNDNLTIDYLKRVIGQYPFGKRLLVWDSFRCHLKSRNNVENLELKKQLKWCGIDTAVVPGGCTKFIQVNLILFARVNLSVFRPPMCAGMLHSKLRFANITKIG